MLSAIVVFPKGALSQTYFIVWKLRKGIPLNPKNQKILKGKKEIMAIYHFSVKNISRSDGRSAVACSAYRSGEKLIDERQGKEQDYTRKTGVELTKIYAPQNTNSELLDRNQLWNKVEKVENRKNSQLAREFEIAFPHELNQQQRQSMLNELCQDIVKRHGVIVDAAIHAPHTKSGSDERNYHAHIMFTTRSIDEHGNLGKKTREFNDNGKQEVEFWRENFADLANKHLARAGYLSEVDHRSFADQGIDLEATWHEGVAVTAMKRRYEREQLKPVEERNPKIIMPTIALENDAIRARNAKKLEYEQIIKGLDQEIIATNSVITDLKRSQLNEINQDHTELHKNQENGLKRNSAQSTNIQNTYQEAKDRLTLLNQQIEQLENNEPPAKKFGLFANKDHENWKETLKNLRDDREETQNQVDQLIIQQMKNPENHLSKGFSQKTKEESKKLDFENVYRQLNQEQKQAYNALKSMLLERFSGSQLELKLKQVQDKFIEKYQENPNFEMPKPDPQRPQQQDFVRGAIKDGQDKGR